MYSSFDKQCNGYTMVMDKGIGFHQMKDQIAIAKPYMQFVKYGFGTSCLYQPEALLQKNRLLKDHEIIAYPGGTLFEAAYVKQLTDVFFEEIISYEFTGVEISHGTVDIPDKEKYEFIRRGKSLDLTVLSEIGKKTETGFHSLLDSIKHDLEAGADFVILEGRESGTSGLYDNEGNIQEEVLETLSKEPDLLRYIIWEAPCKDQQVAIINVLGVDVHFGNVAFEDILSVATLRKGLRSDTMLTCLK
ncbi:hypothetical protein BHU72_02275 [Desulfuribacillus stibiiarsenatis]|uniref:Phosphosulfolactate synthase n=1 Tax=Desulfuribacillus stibiiarsenatis TaxID=1390249 RepID=A0A1E5L6M2_9FIRM|nr:phosphosulfolactate synthase [Desulfuribacillus stibiiarsenatis]OEH85644.1 hypothetical protein BHU72_02275 [Desulfuribacillus stibiiarsenatis]